jgi:hypothetical protein
MIWFLNIAINIAIVGFSVVGLPAALVAAAIYDWQKGKRLKAAGWKVDERDALDNALTVLIWFFAVAAWVVSWGVVALGAWSEPYLGWLIGGSLALGVLWLREQRRRRQSSDYREKTKDQVGVALIAGAGLSVAWGAALAKAAGYDPFLGMLAGPALAFGVLVLWSYWDAS